MMKNYISLAASCVVIAVIFFFLYTILQPFFPLIFIAFVVSLFMSPLFNYFFKRNKMNKHIAACITLITFIVFIFLPVIIVCLLIFQEVKHLIQFLQTQDIGYWENLLKNTLKSYGIPYQQIQIDVKEIAIAALSVLSLNATKIITRTGAFLGNSAFTILLSYYMLVEKDSIFKFFQSVNPLKSQHTLHLYQHAKMIINRTMKGNIILMVLQCVIGTLGLSIFGSIAPILLGLLYGIFSIIPTLGAVVIWLPVSIYLFFYQGWIFAFGFLLWSLLSSFIVEEYIAPRLINEESKVHPILLVMSVVGAVEHFGLIGMLVGPTIVTLSFAALRIYKEIVSKKHI